MPFVSPDRLRILPLRAKLTLWYTLAMALVSLVAMVSIQQGLRQVLKKELQLALEDEAFELAMVAEDHLSSRSEILDQMELTVAGHLRRGWFFEIYDVSTGSRYWTSGRPPARESSSAPEAHAGIQYVDRLLRPPGMPAYRLRVGTSLSGLERDVHNVTRVTTPLLALIMLLAPLGGYLLAGRATSPLQEIITTTRRLRPGQLDERLPIRDTGDELDQLSHVINKFLDQITAHLKRGQEFVANAAHELRSPLTALMTTLDLAMSRERTPAEFEELLGTVHEECRNLAVLTNKLLVLAETDAGLLSVHRTPVDMSQVVRSCLDMFEGVADEKKLALTEDIAPQLFVAADTSRLRQVVNNLVDNAIKFTPPGGQMTVSLRHNLREDQIELLVRDTGIGIPAACLPRIFDRFYQVDRSRSRDGNRPSGNGLGLSICKSVVEAYGGTVHCQSELGTGTSFLVAFPRCPTPAGSVHVTEPATATGQ